MGAREKLYSCRPVACGRYDVCCSVPIPCLSPGCKRLRSLLAVLLFAYLHAGCFDIVFTRITNKKVENYRLHDSEVTNESTNSID
jgi:hypothetical protein